MPEKSLKAAGALALLAALAAPAQAAAAAPGPHVTVAVLPSATGPAALEAAGLAPGLLSAGIGRVPSDQTYLDIGQGNRVFQSLYDDPLPPLTPAGGRVRGWSAVAGRAAGAPADVVPGLLASALEPAAGGGSAAIGASPDAGQAALIAADRPGRLTVVPSRCRGSSCLPRVTVVAARPDSLTALVRGLRGRDLLIAFARPPPPDEHPLAVGIAGAGYAGNLTSDSTRLDGYVLSIDLAPTILRRLGTPVPDQMSGEPIRSAGEADAAAVDSLGDRMAQIQPRRGRVIGGSILAWVLLAALAVAVGGRPAARRALRLLSLSVVLLPALLLLTSALRPALWGEWAVVAVGAPALAALLARLLPGYRALAAACGATVLAHAIDVAAGSPLTSLSLMGPNPGFGVRFYGIGNELEAALAPLTLAGTGAALAAFGPRLGARACALAFLAAGLFFALVFAAGRFGADVGAAIVFPAGAAVAAAVLAGGRRAPLLALAAPFGALALLALIDLLSGGNAHFTRSVLDAGGLHDLGNVAERRLRLSADSFTRTGNLLLFCIVLALGLAAWLRRRDILSWLEGRPAVRAGFAGGLAATLVGTLVNDSGAIVLEVGAAFMLAFGAFAWSQAPRAPTG